MGIENAEEQLLGLLNAGEEPEGEEPEDMDPEGEEPEDMDPEGGEETDEKTDEASDSELVEITYKGETRRVTKAERDALTEKGFDYTQKTQTLAEERRALEQHRAELDQARQELAAHLALQENMREDIGLMTAIELQIKQFDGIDFDALEPEQRFELKDRLRDLKEARATLAGRVESAQRAALEERQRATAKLIQKGREAIKRDIPDFNAETEKQIYEFGQSQGFSLEEIGSIVDPRAIKVLHKAMLYDRLQATKQDTIKRVSKAPPIVRPGAAAPRKGEERGKQLAKLRQTGGRVEDAAALLLDRI